MESYTASGPIQFASQPGMDVLGNIGGSLDLGEDLDEVDLLHVHAQSILFEDDASSAG